MYRFTCFFFAVLFFLETEYSVAQNQNKASASLAIINASIVDVHTGTVTPNTTILLNADTIQQTGNTADIKIPKTALVVDAKGKFIVPGFFDMHVHLSWASASVFPVLVANGITYVRDMGGKLNEIDEWKAKIKAGVITGPQIFRPGPMLNGKAFNPLQIVAGSPEETRAIIRALKHVGVDFIKVHRRMPRESYFAALDEVKKLGLTLVGHIPMTVSPKEASDSGHTIIEHVETIFEGTFTAALGNSKLADSIQQFINSGEAEKLFKQFAGNKTPVTPALVAYRSIFENTDSVTGRNLRKKYVALSYRNIRLTASSPSEAEEARKSFYQFLRIVGLLNRTGVLLLAGTDLAVSRIPGFTLHDELELLVESGLSPLQAIQTTTINPAIALKKEKQFGSVAPGKLANLVLLDANPLIDITNTRKINTVILRGKIFNRKELDKMLAEGEKLALQN